LRASLFLSQRTSFFFNAARRDFDPRDRASLFGQPRAALAPSFRLTLSRLPKRAPVW
jgi:hypothetical protein